MDTHKRQARTLKATRTQRWAAGALIAAAALALLAGCGPSYPASVKEEHAPTITVEHRPVPYLPLIRVAVRIKVDSFPKSFHSDSWLYRWGGHKKDEHPVEVASARWGLVDLPPPGVPKVFSYTTPCHPGRYYTKWHTWGDSKDGTYGDVTEYWPYAPGSEGLKPPTLRESKEIATC